MTAEATALSREIIARHSKSFALASRLLPPAVRDRAVVIYAWCRRADDAVDEIAEGASSERAVEILSNELDRAFAGTPSGDPIVDAFASVAADTSMPRLYPDELIAGMLMDARGHDYATWDDLLLYCYRVAGTVGLMMSHVMGVSDPAALRNAAHLGIAMQLTNISRDIREDWDRERLYVPDELLATLGAPRLRDQLGRPLPIGAKDPLASATGALLERADLFYQSGDRGMRALSPRCAWAVGAARQVYSAIGAEVRRRGCDPFASRAVVSKARKLQLVSLAAMRIAPLVPAASRRSTVSALPPLAFHDVELAG